MATKKQTLSARSYLIVMSVLSLVVVVAAFVFGNVLVGEVIQQGKIQSAKSKASAQLDKDLVQAPLLIQSYNDVTADKMLIADSLPNGPDFASFVSSFDNMTKSAGLNLKGITPAAPASLLGTTGNLKLVGADVSFVGSYASMLTLLSNIEKSSRPIRITGIQMNGSANDLAIQMSVVTFYMDKATLPFSTEAVK